ncbi:unnamed protein product, partial [Polarella glacialis]
HPQGQQPSTGWLSSVLRLSPVVVVLAAAVASNPGTSEEGFRQFLRDRRTFSLAQRLAESLGLVEVRVWNFHVAAVGFEGSQAFLGAFDRWFEVPDSLPSWPPEALASWESWEPEYDVDMLIVGFLLLALLGQLCPGLAARHFVASWPNLCRGRLWCLPVSLQFHEHFGHLLANACFLRSVGPATHELLGRRRFALLYFAGGSFATASSLLLSPVLLAAFRWRRKECLPAVECVGASGALFACLGYLARSDSSLSLRWLGCDWNLLVLAVVQMVLSASAGAVGRSALGAGWQQDAVAHCLGVIIGWAALEYRLL